jgi:endo-alpha-1,4-polygalactosaminidase (GH114 family)/tRNA A-37 threonylcarbamoyl transferase component Bud32
MPNLTGQSIGRYHILEQLGEGGMATVYKVYDTRLERDVAIKIIRTGAFPPEQLEHFLKRFDREAKALARLTHPNIVSVIDYGEFEGAPFLVMTYLPGGTLKPQMGKSMSWREAVKLLLPIAEALDYAHSQNIIHRDIKPSNVLLTQRGQPMLSDFGIAKILESEETAALTGTGVGIGTPEYMAPEQWIGQAGPLSDLYSLGVVLYELVTGRKPYTADTPAAILLKQMNDPLPRPKQFATDLPEELEKVLFKALAKKPEDRFQSMSEFAAALEKLMLGQTSLAMGKLEERRIVEEQTLLAVGTREKAAEIAQKVPTLPEVGKMSRKWGRWAAIGGLVVLVLLGVALGIGFLKRGQKGFSPLAGLATHTATSNMTPSRIAALTPSLAPSPSPEPPHFPAITLNKVRSYELLSATNTDQPGIYAAIASSRVDLIILGGGSYDSPLSRAEADPTRSRLIFAYLKIAEAAEYMYPGLFAGNAVPDWFGHQDPTWPEGYSVQYWNPAWKSTIFSAIDKIIGRDYDGIYLEGLSGDYEWSSGNPFGNPIYPDAVSAMATLLSDIRTHIKSTFPGKTVYLAGSPINIALQFPAVLQNLDAIYDGCIYYCPWFTNASSGVINAKYRASTLAPLYLSANVPVFGIDYPTPLTDSSSVLKSFDFFTSLGWIPSVNNPVEDSKILSTGPFMFMATPANTTVTGYKNFVNYISGGQTSSATLIGGDQGDYFIGGPGQNTINAGSGNDTIYAHPKDAEYKNKIVIQLSSTIKKNGTTPSVSILVNGKVIIQPTPITVANDAGTQEFLIDATPYPIISSVSLIVTNTSYVDQNNFSNVEIDDIIFNGRPLDLSAGKYTSGGSNAGNTYSNNGTVSFPGSSFTSNSIILTDTRDVIDGGGGVNTVIYRGPYSNYSIAQQVDGSWIVTSGTTAEGPDKLYNIQKLVFSDKQVDLP